MYFSFIFYNKATNDKLKSECEGFSQKTNCWILLQDTNVAESPKPAVHFDPQALKSQKNA